MCKKTTRLLKINNVWKRERKNGEKVCKRSVYIFKGEYFLKEDNVYANSRLYVCTLFETGI